MLISVSLLHLQISGISEHDEPPIKSLQEQLHEWHEEEEKLVEQLNQESQSSETLAIQLDNDEEDLHSPENDAIQ